MKTMTQRKDLKLPGSGISACYTRFILEGPLFGSKYPLDNVVVVPDTLIIGAFIRGNKPIDGHNMP